MISSEEIDRIYAEMKASFLSSFWTTYPYTTVPRGAQCEDCHMLGLDVKSRYDGDPERCDTCHKMALLKKLDERAQGA